MAACLCQANENLPNAIYHDNRKRSALRGPPKQHMAWLQVRVRSYANRNQLAADPRDRAEQILEWDRRYVTVLGVANQRLYSFRLQTASDTYDKAQARPRHAVR